VLYGHHNIMTHITLVHVLEFYNTEKCKRIKSFTTSEMVKILESLKL